MEGSSPARLYCLLVGGVLVIAGIIGFFYEASFATGDSIRTEDVFGVLAVNGWHNIVHIAIGAVLLLAAELRRPRGGARRRRALHRPLRPRLHRHRGRRHHLRRQERRADQARPGQQRGQRAAPDPRHHRACSPSRDPSGRGASRAGDLAGLRSAMRAPASGGRIALRLQSKRFRTWSAIPEIPEGAACGGGAARARAGPPAATPPAAIAAAGRTQLRGSRSERARSPRAPRPRPRAPRRRPR